MSKSENKNGLRPLRCGLWMNVALKIGAQLAHMPPGVLVKVVFTGGGSYPKKFSPKKNTNTFGLTDFKRVMFLGFFFPSKICWTKKEFFKTQPRTPFGIQKEFLPRFTWQCWVSPEWRDQWTECWTHRPFRWISQWHTVPSAAAKSETPQLASVPSVKSKRCQWLCQDSTCLSSVQWQRCVTIMKRC